MADKGTSVKPGTTVDARKLVDDAVAATPDPTTVANVMASPGMFTEIDVICQSTGAGGSYQVRLWWWYDTCELWVLDDTVGTVNVSTAGGIMAFPILNNPNLPTANGFHIQVQTFAGGATANVWAQGRGTRGR